MSILITGISGFLGSALARELLAAGEEIHGLSTDLSVDLPGAEVHYADLLDVPRLAQVIERARPRAIVHFAGLSHVGESWRRPGDYLRVNFTGTWNLLNNAGTSRVLFASSAEVYGQVSEADQPIEEDRPLDPRSPYAMTKACAEQVTLAHGGTVVRCFNVIGPGQARKFALPSFADQLAAIRRGAQEPVLKVGDLSPRRDFVFVGDAIAGIRVLLERGEPGEVYNLATGEDHSIEEVLERLRQISGVECKIERDPERVRLVDVPLLRGSSRRLRALGWSPSHCLEMALETIWREALERDQASVLAAKGKP